MSESAKKRILNMPKEERSAIASLASKGKVWIKKDNEAKRVHESEVMKYLEDGWERGRLPKTIETIEKHKNSYQNNKPFREKMVRSEEHKRKIGDSVRGKIVVTDTLTGESFRCDKNDENYLNGRYVSVHKGRNVSEETKEKKKGFVVVRDEDFNTFRCSVEDPKYLSGEYVPAMSGVTVSCPHCGKEGGKTIMKRWHFDNCKSKV